MLPDSLGSHNLLIACMPLGMLGKAWLLRWFAGWIQIFLKVVPNSFIFSPASVFVVCPRQAFHLYFG